MRKLLKTIVGENACRKLSFCKAIIQGRDFTLNIQTDVPTEKIGHGADDFLICVDQLPLNPIVYSAGIGDCIEFESEIIEKLNATVYAFDPTPKSILWLKSQKTSDNFIHYPYAITPKDGNFEFQLPNNENWVSGTLENITDDGRGLEHNRSISVIGKRISTIMNELGHDHIDLLKLDIEGSEFQVIEDILTNDISVGQFCVDTHQRLFKDGGKKLKVLVELFNQHGYFIYDIRNDNGAQAYIKKEI